MKIYKFSKFCSIFILVVSFFMLLQSLAFCESKTITATGDYTMGEGETMLVAKERAVTVAMRNAVEQAGVYVESYSQTKNMQLTKDEVNVIASGIIEVTDKKFTQRLTDAGGVQFIVTITAYVNIDNVESVRNKAQVVQVSDLKVNKFFSDMKIQNITISTQLELSSLQKVQMEGEVYDVYTFFAKSKAQKPCVITLFANKAGALSKITISADKQVPQSINDAFKLEHVILCCLGVSDDEAVAFLGELRNRPFPGGMAIWAKWGNRNLVVEHMPSPRLSSIYYIKITARDRELL